jgi:L-asparaginase
MSPNTDAKSGPYTPTLILHGGAGSITRSHLPPSLYAQYAASLTKYATSTHSFLQSGSTALNAACHAVSLMEDDPLFNCGKGSVFTSAGTIEMEASVMVCSVDPGWRGEGSVKRGAGVSLIRGTRHPILLAKEVLLDGEGEGWREVGRMHCQRSGEEVEEWGWEKKGLERKGRDWFWTRKRWEEHLRGLKGREQEDCVEDADVGADTVMGEDKDDEDNYSGMDLPSQGTVGAVCMDSWGTLVVATSTGGLTNKKPGRIGDTPTLGAGFWAESWDEEVRPTRSAANVTMATTRPQPLLPGPGPGPLDLAAANLSNFLSASLCLPQFTTSSPSPSQAILPSLPTTPNQTQQQAYTSPFPLQSKSPIISIPTTTTSALKPSSTRRSAIALSGTGNGDTFLRLSAARTCASLARFRPAASPLSTSTASTSPLSNAITSIAGPGGELQRSAGKRWQQGTGEGEGGMIGIEIFGGEKEGNVVADFNCGGMWRAWIYDREGDGKGKAKVRVMVFREEY